MLNNAKHVILGVILMLFCNSGESMTIKDNIGPSSIVKDATSTIQSTNANVLNNNEVLNNANNISMLDNSEVIGINQDTLKNIQFTKQTVKHPDTKNKIITPNIATSSDNIMEVFNLNKANTIATRVQEITKDGCTVFADYTDYIDARYEKINSIMKQQINTIAFGNNEQLSNSSEQPKPTNYDIISGINDHQQPLNVNKKDKKRGEKEYFCNNKQAIKQINLTQQYKCFYKYHNAKQTKNSKKYIPSGKGNK